MRGMLRFGIEFAIIFLMKKIILLFTVCAAATVVAFLALINNIYVIVKWWQAFFASGGDSSVMTAEFSGIFRWLDWSVVDYSAVTTFIPALGLLSITLSLLRIIRGKTSRGEDFPFFKGSDQLIIALGLFGTLWGIIVIGYFELETVTMANLMQCLHTALFSTLMAVVWVFMVDRPFLRPIFQRLLFKSGLALTDDGDLADAVARLVVRLDKASDAFDKRQLAFESAFIKRLASFEAKLKEREVDFEASFKDILAGFSEEVADQLKRADAAAIDRQRIAEGALSERLVKAENSLDSRLKKSDDMQMSRIKAFEEAFESRQQKQNDSFNQSITKLDAACNERLALYEREFETRQREYVELFRRRIDELKTAADEAHKQADAANAKLDAITKALHS